MTEERFLSAIFCDDVRREEGNKLSYLGVYEANLFVQDFPIVLPKLCVAMRMRTSPSAPKEVVFKLLRDDELIAEREIHPTALQNASQPVAHSSETSMHLVGTVFQIFPLQLTGPCRFRARAICDGQEFRGGTLAVDQLRVDVVSRRTRRIPTERARKK